MNDTGKVGCYVVILLLMGVFYVCVHIAEFLIKYFTSWQILFGGFAIIALVFMAIALYAEHFKLPPRDNKYATLSYEKKKEVATLQVLQDILGCPLLAGNRIVHLIVYLRPDFNGSRYHP